MKKTYYIFRHGLTLAAKQRRWYWNTLYSAQILDEGKPSIERLAKHLKTIKSDYNVCSNFKRCQQTADIVTRVTGKKFVTDKRIGEYNFEFPWSFKKRILRFIEEMENSDHKVILVCTHSGVIEMLIQYATSGKVSFKRRLKAPLTGVLTIIKDKKITSKDFNK